MQTGGSKMHRFLFVSLSFSLTVLLLSSACTRVSTPDQPEPTPVEPELGAHYSPDGGSIRFAVFSENATAIELDLFAQPTGALERMRVDLEPDTETHVWSTRVSVADLTDAGIDGAVYYGYRAWGPNWTREDGFLADVDESGNRFNPNKLLWDPYAVELSHDPRTATHTGSSDYTTGPSKRDVDTGSFAPKGIVVPPDTTDTGVAPDRPLADEIIYEVHLRGLTMLDPDIPADAQGTYRGAGLEATRLAALGITAVEFQPLHETQNDQNDIQEGAGGDNYWGYSSLSFFAPDRRFAADASPGGPTREIKEMVRAFHDVGIKVYVDVVYNHTGEGDLWGDTDTTLLYSWRGLDNASYYELADDPRRFANHNGVAANLNARHPASRQMVIDSLRYWSEELGVDGFRFDLAAILGNSCLRGCFEFSATEQKNILNRAATELDVDLIAEPWGVANGTYEGGQFPAGWAEWNDAFRDLMRADQNRLGEVDVTPAELSHRLSGSWDRFGDDGRSPEASINFVASHDGFNLRDLYACTDAQNDQPWPYGPSSGGSNFNQSWDQDGDPVRQRQAARTGMALTVLSTGVPMITGGDEMYRTQYCNNNPYNLDSPAIWLDWSLADQFADFQTFSSRLFHFRSDHPALRRTDWYTLSDQNGNGLADLTWYDDTGAPASGAYFDDPTRHFLGWRLDGTEVGDDADSIYIAYNGWSGTIPITLPPNLPGRTWRRAGDTQSGLEGESNFHAAGSEPAVGPGYTLGARSIAVFIER